MKRRFKYRILFYLFVSTIFALLSTFACFLVLSFFDFFIKFPAILQSILCICIFILILTPSFTQLLDLSLAYIQKINRSLKQISNGQFDTMIEIHGNDELTYIAKSINQMANALKESEQSKNDAYSQERRYHELIHQEEKEKQDLIMNVAHDLRTPLTSIIGYMQLLRDHPEYDEKQKSQYLKVAYDKAIRLNQLMDDLFDYTTLTSKYSNKNFTRLNICQLLEQLVDEMYPNFQNNHCKCHLHIDNHQIYIYGDGILLFRVFDNLINNALKYKNDTSDITIDVLDKQSLVMIRISNEGPTIPKEELDHLFDQFYRSDASRSSKSGGTGLGLAISKSIVDMHDGEIFAISKNNQTSFIVTFKKSSQS